MAGILAIQKASGGVLNVTATDGATSTDLVLPLSGTVLAADANGNVGIGTSAPQLATAHINTGTNGFTLNLQGNSSTNLSKILFTRPSNGAAGSVYVEANSEVSGNYLKFVTGTGSLTLDHSGNVGIGVTPSAWTSSWKVLQNGNSNLISTSNISEVIIGSNYVRDAVGYKYLGNAPAAFTSQFNGSFGWYTAPSGTAGNAISWTNAMSLYSSGELVSQFIGTANTVGYMTKSSTAAGTGYYHYVGQSNGVDVVRILGNGNIQNTNNSYGAISDIKLKENIIDVSPKLDKLMQVRIVNYNLIGDEQKQIGVIAQEIEKIFPGVVGETKDIKQVEVQKERIIPAVEEVKDDEGNVITEAVAESIETYTETETVETGEVTKNVKYSVIYMMMLKGMQEQNEIINDLKARIEILEAKWKLKNLK